MFPYRPRKPAWGSVKPTAAVAPTGTGRRGRGRGGSDNDTPPGHPGGGDGPSSPPRLGGDESDPLTVGGNLQRAVLLDMVGLRDAYRRAEAPPGSGGRAAVEAPGASFGRFKRTFAGLRFGAVHTRTIPPRVDRAEYVQLLYSSALYLLEVAFGDPPSLAWGDSDGGDGGDSAFDAVFAAFLLYALRQTDVLPPAPAPRVDGDRGDGPGGFDPASPPLEAWSMLPLGLEARPDDKLGRRAFRSPVRIDRWCYHLLLRLRDACQGRVDECQLGILNCDDSSDSDGDGGGSGGGGGEHLRHLCLAGDAVRVVDRMVSPDSDFFDYCEYHGPASLEGLAGFPNFYRAHFLGRKGGGRRGTDPGDGEGSGLGAVLTAMALSRRGEGAEEREGERSDELRPAQDGGDGDDATEGPPPGAALPPAPPGPPDLLSFDDSVPPAVRAAVRGCLVTFRDEVEAIRDEERRRYQPPPHEARLGGGREGGGGGGDVIEVDPVLELLLREDGGARKRRGGRTARKTDGGGKEDPGPADVDEVSVATGAGRRALRSLLGTTEGGSDDEDELARPRKRRGGRAAKTTGGGKTRETAPEDTDEVSVATGAGRRALSSLLETTEGGSDLEDEPVRPRKRKGGRAARKTGGGKTRDTAPEDADEVSVATGAGKTALRSLLGALEGGSDGEDESARPRKRRGGRAVRKTGGGRKGDPGPADADEVSVATGAGKRALRSLLGAMDGGPDGEDEPRPIKRRTGTGTRAAGKKTLPEDADEVSVATGAGKLALRSLFASMDAGDDDDDSLLTMLDAAGGGSSDGGEETSRGGDDGTPGADFSSIRDDDGTASVYSGMGKRALGFLLAQSSRAEE